MPLLDSIFGFPRVPMQRNYLWDFVLPSFGLLVDGIVVSRFCQSCRFGQYNISDATMMQVGAYKRFFPGVLNIESAFATYITPIPDMVSLYFSKWKSLIVDKEGFYFPSNHYKKNIYVMLYDRSGVPTNFAKLKGAFPIKFPSFNLDYEATKMVQFDVEFKVDSVEMGADILLGALGIL